MLKPRTLKLTIAERITRIKKNPRESIEFNIQDPCLPTLYLTNSLLKKPIFKTLGINPRELTARNSEAR